MYQRGGKSSLPTAVHNTRRPSPACHCVQLKLPNQQVCPKCACTFASPVASPEWRYGGTSASTSPALNTRDQGRERANSMFIVSI